MRDDFETDRPSGHLPGDAQPDPEPAAPSLPSPDPGVFHPDAPATLPSPESTAR